ncbi:MAG: hypothetical protein ABIN58_08780, partial [candidate division WOR-3 bacterium]
PDEMPSSPAPKGQRLHIAYLGSMFGEHKRPEGLFGGLMSLPKDFPVEFSFIGNKSTEAKVLIRKLGERFPAHDSDYLPHSEAIGAVSSAHALLILSTRGPHYELISPGKTFEALGTRRAILGVVPKGTWIWNFLDENNTYMADPDEPDEIKEAVIRLANDWHHDRLMFPDNEKIKAYAWENLARELSARLEDS